MCRRMVSSVQAVTRCDLYALSNEDSTCVGHVPSHEEEAARERLAVILNLTQADNEGSLHLNFYQRFKMPFTQTTHNKHDLMI